MNCLLASSDIEPGLLQVALLVIHIINLSVHLVVRLLTMRNKSGTRQPKFLLSRIRTDMRDLGLPVLQDPTTSHLGTHPLVPATFQVMLLILTLMESSIQGKVGPGTIHKEIIVDVGAMVGYSHDNLFLLQTIIQTDPHGAVNFALMMSQMEGGFPVDYNTITDFFFLKVFMYYD
ncbi:uncharacterized protein LOC106767788 [Vigna radiata var. radiata]|uniref:Uncharacterized protein LOC106767788 n=1 Tax=Vigna radiata var. radiata TaxID=3916 RepID=A0A1S3UQD4_VIGRR|nr:uncharacterized protein LOC106767788 [Vigna radiata var. radiata]